MAKDSIPQEINPNLTLMQAELRLNCKSLGVIATSPEILELRARAAKIGITTTVCDDKSSPPGRLLINVLGDPQIAQLSQRETEARQLIAKRSTDTSYRLVALETKRLYDSAVSEASSRFQLLLGQHGITEMLSDLQIKHSDNSPTYPKMIQVMEKLNQGATAASAPKR